MLKKLAVSSALVAGVVQSASAAVTATSLGTALDAASLLSGVEDKVLAIGGVIIGLAVVGAGIKWVKGTVFS